MAAPLAVSIDELLIKLIAIAGTPVTTRPYLNITSGATASDNPGFTDPDGNVVGSTDLVISGSGGGYSTVESNGTPETARTKLNFIGPSVADNSGSGSTDVTVEYQTVQSGGSSQTPRPKLNIIGATVADNPGNGSTDVTIEYQTIQSGGVSQTQRAKFNIINGNIADDSGNGSTDLTLEYQTVQAGGSSQTQRAKLNFIGLQVADNSSNGSTDVTALPGWVNVTSSTPVTLSLTQRNAYVESFFGVSMSVVFPATSGAIVAGTEFTIRDGGSAALFPFTVSAADSANIESPYDNSLSSTQTISSDKASITWISDGSTWRVKHARMGAGDTWTTNMTSTTVTASAEALDRGYWLITGSLSANSTLTIPVPSSGATSARLTWIIDATGVTLNGHTLSLKMNGNTWATTIGTTNIYRVVYGSTGKLYGVTLTP